MTVDRLAVVGGGIVGMAVARRLLQTRPGVLVEVFDKEPDVGVHQTGHNSGVVHAGLYYEPGSLKADLCRAGRIKMREFCQEHGVPYRELGKVVVATDQTELPALHRIFDRAVANRVPRVKMINAVELRELEPEVRGIAAVHSPESAVTDFQAVARSMAQDVSAAGGKIRLGTEVRQLVAVAGGVRVDTATDAAEFDAVVACAGLGTDHLTGRSRLDAAMRVVPFRGAYFALAPRVRDRVRGLIYPVPDPRYPFLGVHLTRRFDDEVLVGPTAVLATARDGYRLRDVDGRDLRDLLRFPGFWRMAHAHWRTGARELWMAASARAFVRQARRYMPQLTKGDLRPYPAGIRAQALRRDGALVDDFVIDSAHGLTIVRNAPSPAATSSLAIAEYVVDRLAW